MEFVQPLIITLALVPGIIKSGDYMIHLNDTIKKLIDKSRYHTLYRATCDSCGADRGYLTKQNALRYPNCASCAHKDISEETKRKMSEAKKGKTPWNRGKSGVSDSTREKMRKSRLGRIPWNKGKSIEMDTRIKLSCVNQGIPLDEFDGFTTEESKQERNKFTDSGLHIQCFE